MSRTAVVAFFLTLFILGKAALAAPPICDDRILGFNTYEDYDDKMQPDFGVTVFEVEEYAPDSSFEGLLVKAANESELKLEIGLSKKKSGAASSTKSFALEKSDHKRGYFTAAGLEPKKLFAGDENYFVLRLVKNGKAVCEDEPKEIFPGD
ncbi:MAG: hypothetical protein EOP11_01285 [Proteobacteria bacterium]|nr:MAG: hypothetical protein EOP11_01285 [Pseudomonadota bacterium]